MVATLDQLKTVSQKLAEYHSKLETSLTTPGSPLPSFEDYIDYMEVPNILEDSVASQNRSSSFATGALTDTVHRTDAAKREFGIRTKSKSAYFSDAASDMAVQNSYYTSLYAKYLNYIRRTSPEQAPD